MVEVDIDKSVIGKHQHVACADVAVVHVSGVDSTNGVEHGGPYIT